MSKSDELEMALGQVCHLTFNLIGRTQAYEIYLSSLASTLIDHYPELREQFKENFVDVSDIQRKMIQSDVTLQSFDETVKILVGHFSLMKGGGFFDDKQ